MSRSLSSRVDTLRAQRVAREAVSQATYALARDIDEQVGSGVVTVGVAHFKRDRRTLSDEDLDYEASHLNITLSFDLGADRARAQRIAIALDAILKAEGITEVR